MIHLGILGCGRVVINRYVDVFLNELNNVDVKIVCDVDKIKANKVSKLLKSLVVYNENELFSAEEVDAILVCTESGKHFLHAKAALESGKHVITEKPPALLPNQIIELEKIAKKET